MVKRFAITVALLVGCGSAAYGQLSQPSLHDKIMANSKRQSDANKIKREASAIFPKDMSVRAWHLTSGDTKVIVGKIIKIYPQLPYGGYGKDLIDNKAMEPSVVLQLQDKDKTEMEITALSLSKADRQIVAKIAARK